LGRISILVPGINRLLTGRLAYGGEKLEGMRVTVSSRQMPPDTETESWSILPLWNSPGEHSSCVKSAVLWVKRAPSDTERENRTTDLSTSRHVYIFLGSYPAKRFAESDDGKDTWGRGLRGVKRRKEGGKEAITLVQGKRGSPLNSIILDRGPRERAGAEEKVFVSPARGCGSGRGEGFWGRRPEMGGTILVRGKLKVTLIALRRLQSMRCLLQAELSS